jgi:hypothetical protein
MPRREASPIAIARCAAVCRGAVFTTWSSVPADKFSLSADEGALRSFAVSGRTTKYFCTRCGTTLYHVTSGYEGVVGLLMGTLRTPVSARPTGHYFYSDRADWASAPHDRLPLFGGASGFEPLDP